MMALVAVLARDHTDYMAFIKEHIFDKGGDAKLASYFLFVDSIEDIKKQPATVQIMCTRKAWERDDFDDIAEYLDIIPKGDIVISGRISAADR